MGLGRPPALTHGRMPCSWFAGCCPSLARLAHPERLHFGGVALFSVAPFIKEAQVETEPEPIGEKTVHIEFIGGPRDHETISSKSDDPAEVLSVRFYCLATAE